MALLFVDGFDVGDYAVKGWSLVDSNAPFPGVFSLQSGRINGNGFSIATATNGSSAQDLTARKLFTGVAQLTLGVAVRPTAYPSGGNGGGFAVTLYSDSGSTAHLTVMSNATTQAIELRRGTRSGTLIASSGSFVPVSAWGYLEIQATIADAGGICTVRLNGSSSPIIAFTGDTRNAGTLTTIDSITLGAYRAGTSGGVASAVFDDFYILDALGTTHTTFLGDIKIQSLLPTGNGADSALMGSDGNQTDNYQQVDEVPYSTTDYNASATTGQRDTYTFGDLPPAMNTVLAVQSNIVAAKSDVTPLNARIPLRVGGSLYYGATNSLSTSYLTYSDVHQVNPNTSAAWTPAAVNGLEAGMEVA